MISYMVVSDDASGRKYWAYGNPGQWAANTANVRLYARRVNADKARLCILKKHPELDPSTLKVIRVLE